MKVVKDSSHFISEILANIYNSSIHSGIFPYKLKLSYIIPAHKGNSKMSIGNYRPISVIPIFGKIFEKLIHSRLMSFLNKENILFDHQFGFRSKRSTDLAILDIIVQILKTINLLVVYFLTLQKRLTPLIIKFYHKNCMNTNKYCS